MKTLLCLLMLVSTLHAADLAELIVAGDRHDVRFEAEAALVPYLQAEKLAPKDASLLVKISRQYVYRMTSLSEKDQLQSCRTAVSYAERAIACAPNECDPHLALAICLGKLTPLLGAKESVATSFKIKQAAETAVRLNPKSDYAWHMLGRWHQALAEIGGVTRALAKVFYGGLPPASHQEALKCFEKAHALNANRLIHAIELGRTHAALGNTKEARRYIEQGLAMKNTEKDDPETKERGRATLENLSS
jgi:tetratricopeptide (TPR) repeat protein